MTADFRFKQSTTSYLEYGINATYYQHGRNTPVERIGTGMANTFKTIYFNSKYPYTTVNKQVSRGVAIQNPTNQYWTENGDWNSKTKQKNFWDVKNTSSGVYDNATSPSIKTIYDPCPVGYKVPEPEAFTGLTSTGNNSSTKVQFNVSGNYSNGWTFYTQPNKKGSTFFIPALNLILYNTGGFYQGFGQSIWAATCGVGESSSPVYTRSFYFTPSIVNPMTVNRRSYANPILPVADK